MFKTRTFCVETSNESYRKHVARKMIANAWKWAEQRAGRKRVNEVHGEEEVRVVLKDSFEFMEEEGDTTTQDAGLELEDLHETLPH